MATDFELLDAWADGDKAAANELFSRYFDALFRFFSNKLDSAVDDLVQDTFLACIQGRDRFRRDASFRTYMFATARHLLWQHVKNLRRGEHVDVEAVSLFDLGASPSSMAARKAGATAPIALSAEEMSVDVVEISAHRLGTPQAGVLARATVSAWGPFNAGNSIGVENGSTFEIYVQAAWVGSHTLRVDCRGWLDAALVSWSRSSWTKHSAELVGEMILDQEGHESLSFIVPRTSLGGWEYLVIGMKNAGDTYPLDFRSCTMTRLPNS